MSDPPPSRLIDEVAELDDTDALLILARTAVDVRQPDAALAALEKATEIADATRDDNLLACLMMLGALRTVRGDSSNALPILQRARALAEERVDEYGTAFARLHLAMALAELHQVERAEVNLEAGLAYAATSDSPEILEAAREAKAIVELRRGDDAAFIALRREHLALLEESGDEALAARHKIRVAAAAQNAGNTEEAVRLIAEALPILERANDHLGIAHALEGRGVIERRSNRPLEAIETYRRAREEARLAGDAPREARLIVLSGYCLVHVGRFAEAVEAFADGLSRFEDLALAFEQADAHVSLGIAYRNLGDRARSAEHYAKAAELFWELDLDAKADECQVAIVALRS
jgi:tetratricopeptide (TPR) repeat protein